MLCHFMAKQPNGDMNVPVLLTSNMSSIDVEVLKEVGLPNQRKKWLAICDEM